MCLLGLVLVHDEDFANAISSNVSVQCANEQYVLISIKMVCLGRLYVNDKRVRFECRHNQQLTQGGKGQPVTHHRVFLQRSPMLV